MIFPETISRDEMMSHMNEWLVAGVEVAIGQKFSAHGEGFKLVLLGPKEAKKQVGWGSAFYVRMPPEGGYNYYVWDKDGWRRE